MPVKRGFMVFGVLMLVCACTAPALGAALPNGWTNKDFGTVNRPGSSTFDPAKSTWTVVGEGSDIWGTGADNFQFAYTQLKGDGNITARVVSQAGGHDDGWARNGLMIRESEAVGSRRLDFMLGSVPATPAANSGGWWYSYRRPETDMDNVWNQTLGNFPQSEGQAANRGAVGTRELPVWVRLQRQGDLITAYLSPDGKVWSSQIVPQTIGSAPLPQTMLVGLAVCGHNPDASTGDLSTMVCDNVSVSNDLLLPGPSDVEATPSRTDTQVLVTWTGRPNATGYTIYRQVPGDKQFTKAGATTNLTWFIDMGPDGKGLKAGTNYRYVVTATVPQKANNKTVDVETAASYPALVTPGPIPSPIGSFLSSDIGTAFQGSTTLDDKGVLTIQASGTDIWNAGDGMRFVGSEARGNVTMTAKILEKPTSANKDGWVKAGLMVRESLDPASRAAWMVATTNDSGDHASTAFQWRRHFSNSADDSLGGQDGTAADATKYPLWLRIGRVGSRITGFQSADGTTFTKVGGDDGGVTLDRLPARIYIGFAVTNHRDGDLATAKFDANSVAFQ